MRRTLYCNLSSLNIATLLSKLQHDAENKLTEFALIRRPHCDKTAAHAKTNDINGGFEKAADEAIAASRALSLKDSQKLQDNSGLFGDVPASAR
jgi:hypothetical protein